MLLHELSHLLLRPPPSPGHRTTSSSCPRWSATRGVTQGGVRRTDTWQAQSGEFVYTNDADEFVRLDRHRRTVAVDGRRGAMALSDAAAMSWCWEEAPPDDVAIRAALAAIAEDVVETRTSRRAKRSRRRTKSR